MIFSTSGFFIKQSHLGHGPFRIWLRNRKVIRQSRWHSSVNDTAVADTAVSMTPLWPTPRIQLCKPGSKSQKHSGVIDAAVADTAVSMTLLCQYDTAVPGDLGKLYYPIAIKSQKKI
jgi:hypothetical protein